jgi:SAM-dependent methyltransferase
MPILCSKTHLDYQRQSAGYADAVWLNMRGPDSEKTERVARYVLSRVRPYFGQTIADVGCGDGTLLRLTSSFVRRIGILPTVEEVTRLKASQPDFDVVLGAVQNLPLRDEQADCVVCNGVLLLFPAPQDIRGAISEMARITKPNGLVYIGEIPEAPYHGADHATPYRWLTSLLRTHGLYHFAAGLKDLVVASVTSTKLMFHPDPQYFSSPTDFITLAEAHSLREVWHARHPFDGERWDYLFMKTPGRE